MSKEKALQLLEVRIGRYRQSVENMEKSIARYEKSIEFVRGGLIELCNALETLEEIQSELMETQEVRVAPAQVCYKSDKPCDYDCSGLCKDSY